MRDINTIAVSLAKTRDIINEIKVAQLGPYEKTEEALRGELLEALKAARLKSVKVEEGPTFARSERVNYGIVDPIAALAWAKKNKCISVDKAAANKILRTKYPDMPKGFEVNVTEFISVKSAKNDGEVD